MTRREPFQTFSQRAVAGLPRVKPWWCSCDSGGGFDGVHESWCYGEQEAMPRLNAALRQREASKGAGDDEA